MLSDRLLRGIKDELLTPERMKLMARAMREYFERETQLIKDSGATKRAVARLAAIDREMANVANAIAQIGVNDRLKKKYATLTEERDELRTKTRRSDQPALAARHCRLAAQAGTAKPRPNRIVRDEPPQIRSAPSRPGTARHAAARGQHYATTRSGPGW